MELIERFFEKQPKNPRTVLLIGDNGGPWGSYASEVTRLLSALNVKVIGQFPSYTAIADLKNLSQAAATVVLGSYGQSSDKLEALAEKLYREYGMEYMSGIYPVGWRNTKQWLLYMGMLFDCYEQAKLLCASEERRLQEMLGSFLPVTAGRKTVLCIGRWLQYFKPVHVLESIANLQLDLQAIVLLDCYTPAEKDKMRQAIEAATAVPVYDADKADKLMEGAELVLTTHELQNKQLRQIFLSMLPKAGAEGEIAFGKAVYHVLKSRRINGGMVYE